MILYLREPLVNNPLGSEVEIWICKIKNIPEDQQALTNHQIEMLIRNDLIHITRDVAELLHAFHVSIVRHLNTIGYLIHNLTEHI